MRQRSIRWFPHIICEKDGKEDMATNLKVGFKERQHKCLSESITVVIPPTKKPCMKVLCPMPVSTIHPMPKPSSDVAGPSRLGPSHVLTMRPSDSFFPLSGPSTSSVTFNDDSVKCVASIPPHSLPVSHSAPQFVVSRISPMQDYTTFKTVELVVVNVCNLMRQHTLLLKWLEVAEAMRAYIAQHMEGSEEFHTKLKLVENELVATQKATDEVVGLLRNIENEKKVAKAKARQLREKEEATKAKCKKIEQKNE
ncbi:hypothetical protein AAG906_014322 [Vitis piasezkii]